MVPLDSGAILQHAVYFAAATILTFTATGVGSAELTAAATILRRFTLAMLFPAIWMIAQIIPLPFVSLVNPIWSNAAVALNEASLTARISIDPGATLRSLMWYLAVLSLVLSTLLLTKDRRRAELVLVVLTVVATVVAVQNIIDRVGFFGPNLPSSSKPTSNSIVTIAVMAVLGNVATIIMAIERQRNRSGSVFLFKMSVRLGLLSIAGFAVSLWSIAILGQRAALGLAALGLLMMAFVAIARRVGSHPWPTAIVAGIFIAIICAAALAMLRAGSSFGLADLARLSAPESLSVAQRATSDSPPVGSGVGTFEQVASIYRDYGSNGNIGPPSTAISIVIEWGPLALPILALFTLQIFFFVLRGAVGRGRDSFFASAAAAAIIVALGESFLDSSLLTPASQIMLAVMIGLGISQSSGRTGGIEPAISNLVTGNGRPKF